MMRTPSLRLHRPRCAARLTAGGLHARPTRHAARPAEGYAGGCAEVDEAADDKDSKSEAPQPKLRS